LVEDSRKYVHEDQILRAASEGGMKDSDGYKARLAASGKDGVERMEKPAE
jgi:hypothetical protein